MEDQKFGAIWEGNGTTFRIFSHNAEAVEVCLLETVNGHETQRAQMRREGDIWSAYLPNIGPGQCYGYRVHGPWQPKKGHRFNPNKLLLDPYAKSVQGQIEWCNEVYAYQKDKPQQIDPHDNVALVPNSVVIDPYFDWEGDQRPQIPMCDSVVYELHIKGFTQQHPGVPAVDRGKYLGLTAPAILDYFRDLGVTSLELLPCMFSVTSKRLYDIQLKNYWGYDPLLWFAPDPRFAKHDPVFEFKQMVKSLHRAGIEVILDVVFNHTGEESVLGPSLSFRGIDNRVYYVTEKSKPHKYWDFTGCGNSVNAAHPQVRRMIVDCLRYWVEEMHVDGFRFDLITTIMREAGEFNLNALLLEQIEADPTLSSVKLIAEPWDLGPNGYQLGQFSSRWSEWNDHYRDTLRSYWRGDESRLADFAHCFTGSSDIFNPNTRSAAASLNFICAHDGFTLRDLVSYSDKHNAQNGEDNRDGHNNNLSYNYGVEGLTENPEINRIRLQQQRNLLASLLLSHGLPMLLAGDEINRTQKGNNNAYCQDNEISWLDWNLDNDAQSLYDFVRYLIRLRKEHTVFRPEQFLRGSLRSEIGYRDVEWLRPDGNPMSSSDWQVHYARFITVLLTTGNSSERNILMLFNAGEDPIHCHLPSPPFDGRWQVLFDTAKWPDRGGIIEPQVEYEVVANSMVALVESISPPKTA